MSAFDRAVNLCMNACLDYYGEKAVFLPASGGRFTIPAILDENVGVVDTSGEVPVETPMPVLSVKPQSFDRLAAPRPRQGDRFIVKGRVYSVCRNPEDGYAESRLVLFYEGDF